MRIKAALTALLLAACPAFAQQLNPTTQINWPLITGQGTPTSLNLACTSQVGLTVNITTSTGVVTGASIAAGGSGILVVPQTVNLLGGGGTGALLTITAASGGAATAITVTAGGSGYSNTSAVRASLANFGQPFQNLVVTPNTYYTCGNDGWGIRSGGAPTGAAGGVLGGTYPNPTLATSPYLYASLNMPHWRAALAKVKQGTGQARLCAVGDSTTAGFFANGPPSGNSNLYSYPTQLANILQTAYGIRAQSQAVFEGGQELPSGGDSRIVVGSSWSLTTAMGGIPNGTSVSTTTTNALSFTPSIPVDTFRMLYVIETTEGTGSVNIDGGSSTSFTGTGAAGVGVLTVTAGSLGTHTLNILEVSGSVHVIGFEGFDSTHSSIIIENIGAPGITSASLSANTKPYNAGTAAMYTAVGCDLVNLNDGLNDWGTGVSVGTYTTNMQTVITAVKGGGSDIILESPNHSDPSTGVASEATQSTFVEALRGLALANSENNLASVPLPFIDTWARWQTFAISSALGLYGDPSGTPSEHPGTVGYREKADQIAQAIAETPSQNNGEWDYRTLFQWNPNTNTWISLKAIAVPSITLNGGTPLTGQSSAQSQIVTCPTGGTSTQYCGADGAWHTASGAGTVTNIATTSPLAGGPITGTGTLTCLTCVTSAASLASNAVVIGGGGQASSTIGVGTTTMVLHGNASGPPSYGAVTLTTDVAGILPVSQGGTGTATPNIVAGSGISVSGTWPNQTVTATGGGTGTVTHTVGALTAQDCVIGNGAADIKVDPNCSLDGSGNMTAASYTAVGTTPGSASLVAGTGSIPALPANSFGFAAPVTGGTSYLIKAPATITAGIAHFAAPATADGVNESALTSSAVNLASADVTGLLPVANGGTGTSTPGIVAGTNVTVTGTWPNQTVNSTGGGSSAFSSLTSGTNSTAAMVVGTGASLAVSGSGTIAATTTNAIAGNVTFSTGLSTTGAGTIASPYVVTTTGAGATTLASVASGIAPSSSGSYDFNNNDIINNTLGTAISSANFSSSNHIFRGSFWTGTVAAADGYTIFNQITTAGANPPTRLIISHAGSTGLAQVQVPDLIDVALGSSTSPVCPNGTNNALTTSGCAGGSTTWNGIANPTGNQALTMGNNTTTWTFGAATGATTPMVSITDTASNTGTGAVLKLNTAASSNAFPMQLFQRGTALLTVGATAGGTGSGFAGTLFVNATSNAQFTGLYVGGSGAYVIGTSFFTAGSGGSVGNAAAVSNVGQTTGTGAQLTFDGQNTGFALTPIAGITGVMTAPAGSTLTGDMVFCVSNASTCTERMRLKAAGDLDVTQIVGNSSTPTMVAGVAAGAAPSCTTVVGTNLSGVLTCTTGTAPATGILATVTFAGTLPVAPQGCALMPRNALTAATTNNIFTSAPSTTTWTINVVVALTLSTAYSWSYSCI